MDGDIEDACEWTGDLSRVVTSEVQSVHRVDHTGPVSAENAGRHGTKAKSCEDRAAG